MKDMRLPEGWRLAKLGSLCRIELGSTPARKSKSLWDAKRETGNVWLSIADMPSSLHAVASDSKEYVSDAAAKSMKVVPAGTLLVSFKLTLGRLCYAGRDLFTNEAIAALLNLDARSITKEFLYWYLTFFDWHEAAAGDEKVKGKTLNKAKLKELEVWLPPLAEQKRTVAVLDQAFAVLDRARALAEANLADAEEVFRLQRESMLDGTAKGWTAAIIGEICDRFEYGTSAKSQPKGQMPVLRMGNLQGGRLDWSDLVFTDNADDIRKLRLEDGDVLFNRTNSIDHVGKTAIYRGERPAIFAGYLIRLHRKKSLVDAEFLNLYLNSGRAREYGRSVMGKSVNQANISASKLASYPIALPTLAEQVEIARSLNMLADQVDGVRARYQAKLSEFADLRQSLLRKAFAGELT